MPELTPEQETTILALNLKMRALGYNGLYSHLESGPVITQYYFKPDAASPLTKILSKTEDLALACKVESVLVMREKGLINVSVPNKERSIIKFDNCLYWLASCADNAGLLLLMGQTPLGENFRMDLCSQPHILIAGSTGSGKSLFLSQLIASLVVQKDPSELKLLLVDTKQLDLTLFKSLPHVITVVDKVLELHEHLDRMIKIVRQRTEAMKGTARNIAEYCALTGKQLPYYVIVIDELADVIGLDMELSRGETKDSKRTRISAKIAQIAQISRATGIHIIAATQRPSIKILSGDIKTNFPTRISFRLPTGVDSRVILDENGAEVLLGRGDYLFRTAEDSTLRRAHSSYISMNDIAMILTQHKEIRKSFAFFKGELDATING